MTNSKAEKIYKIVQSVGGQIVITNPSDILTWAQANGWHASFPTRSSSLRSEIRFEPRIRGLCGPMYDGEQNGVPVVRYEDGLTNDLLSR